MNYPKKNDTRLSGYDEVFLYLETKNVPKMITEKIQKQGESRKYVEFKGIAKTF